MSGEQKKFIAGAASAIQQRKARKREQKMLSNYPEKQATGSNQFINLELARKRAKAIKWRTIEHLDKQLITFERHFTEKGGKVCWASNAGEAVQHVQHILKQHEVKQVVKSKSMVTEEIGLRQALTGKGIRVEETDLGEYINQLDGQRPSHMVTPAMHKSGKAVAELFRKKLGVQSFSAADLTVAARKKMRQRYATAGASITGANFLVADKGNVLLCGNEGNIRLCTALPPVHIIVAGIEKVLPDTGSAELFLSLLASHGTGQQLTTYNTFITPTESKPVYVILLDNGRSRLLADTRTREALYCIRCGACLNVCPVFQSIGGHAYNTTYGGPIGSVISPYLGKGRAQHRHLSEASTLCGKCSDICPVHIDIHNMLLYNRYKFTGRKQTSRLERWQIKSWKKMMLSRKRLNWISAGMKNRIFRYLFKKHWGTARKMPKVAPKSFNQLWKDRPTKQ